MEEIIRLANELVKAINDAGYSIMDPRIGPGFGSLNLYIHKEDKSIEIQRHTPESKAFCIEGALTHDAM